jgi:glycosyltransferase involved in cell wall biosynthesis
MRARSSTEPTPTLDLDTGWAGCLIVLQIPTRSQSLHFHAYAERLTDRSVIDWAVARLRRATGGSQLSILSDAADTTRISGALHEHADVLLWTSSGLGELQDLDQLAASTESARLLIADLTAALLPPAVFERLLECHLASGHHATMLRDLPCSSMPVLVETNLLSMLAGGGAGLPRNLRLAVAGLERTGAITAGGKRFEVMVRRAGVMTAGEQAARAWPFATQLWNPADVAILRRALYRANSGEADTDLLSAWTAAEREEERLAVDTGGLSPSRRQPGSAGLVLFVQSPSAFTGVEQVLALLAQGLDSRRPGPFDCAALVGLPGFLTDLLADAGAAVCVANRDFARGSVANYLYCARALDTIQPTIVHSHSIVGVPFCCAVADRGVPFVQHVHLATETALVPLTDQIRCASAVIAVSEFVKGRVIRLGVDPEKVHVIHNGTAISQIAGPDAAVRSGVRRACTVPEDARIILLVARYSANKRHDVAVEALALARARGSNVYLLLAGEVFADGQLVFEDLTIRIRRLGLQDRVRFLGFRRDMANLYAAADIVVLPSEDDPLPMTVLEAMAAGIPIVAARSGGIPEMIHHGTSGLLAEPGRPEEFAEGIEQLLTREDLRARLIAGALDRCRDHFGLSRFISQVADIYGELLRGDPITEL